MNRTEKAYAKINLFLQVCGLMENGYHDLRMVMETVDIHDDVIIERSTVPGISLTCEFGEELSGKGYELSSGRDNLIVRAGNALLEYAAENGITDPEAITPDKTPGYDIRLIKRIPMAAGMAGGSTDAAATLRGIASFFDKPVSSDTLCRIGAKLGADIPYCIPGGSRLAEGIGDVLTPLPDPPKTYLIIVKPNIDVSTAHIYKMTDSNTDYASSDRQRVDSMFNMLKSGLETGDLSLVAKNLYNDLRFAAISEHPVIRELENALSDAGALGAMMSGSGPSVFALFDDENARDEACLKIKEAYPDIYATRSIFR